MEKNYEFFFIWKNAADLEKRFLTKSILCCLNLRVQSDSLGVKYWINFKALAKILTRIWYTRYSFIYIKFRMIRFFENESDFFFCIGETRDIKSETCFSKCYFSGRTNLKNITLHEFNFSRRESRDEKEDEPSSTAKIERGAKFRHDCEKC